MRPDGTPIAMRHRAGTGPTIIFLPGYASDMAGTKAIALDDWATRTGHPLLRFDYGGCGESGGAFEDQTLDGWLGDALIAVDSVTGPVVLIGSSMGGWLMLLVALARPSRIDGLIGLAAAPDFTEWGYTDAQKHTLLTEGRVFEDSPYGPPMLTTRAFWESGNRHTLLHDRIAIDAPVRLIQGQRDNDVPWQTALRIAGRLRSADVQTIFVKDGNHRLSRPRDIGLIIATLEALLENL